MGNIVRDDIGVRATLCTESSFGRVLGIPTTRSSALADWQDWQLCLSQLVVLVSWVMQLDDPTATAIVDAALSSHGEGEGLFPTPPNHFCHDMFMISPHYTLVQSSKDERTSKSVRPNAQISNEDPGSPRIE